MTPLFLQCVSASVCLRDNGLAGDYTADWRPGWFCDDNDVTIIITTEDA